MTYSLGFVKIITPVFNFINKLINVLRYFQMVKNVKLIKRLITIVFTYKYLCKFIDSSVNFSLWLSNIKLLLIKHLLALTTAIESVKERKSALDGGRFVIQFEPLHKELQGIEQREMAKFPNLWVTRLRFPPNRMAYNKWKGKFKIKIIYCSIPYLKLLALWKYWKLMRKIQFLLVNNCLIRWTNFQPRQGASN